MELSSMAAISRDLSLSIPHSPILSPFCWTGLSKTKTKKKNPLLLLHLPPTPPPKPLLFPTPRASFPLKFQTNSPRPNSHIAFAGRSKKKPGGPSPGRIEGNAEVRRQAKQAARKRSRRLAENLFYRHNNPTNQADQFSEEELQMIGLGYDRMVRFMEKDDPNLRHPHDWYKYGHYGPYSWRGVVIGRPIRGRFTDDRVTLIGEVRDHEEWEKIEQFEMTSEFGERLKTMDAGVGFRYFWVFVRHPKWKATELPWQQWTLVSEVVVESGKQQRLDKWGLMGRLGNKARTMITQCAAWMRPDIIYVRRPVYQCRFEPQDDFFRVLGPLLDPSTEDQYLFELKDEQGRVVDVCTYFAGLCKIVKINQKAFVDDVVRAYQKLSDEDKSRCLEFLLTNHPLELLHPYTKEWKAKLEEMELGCDAPDDSDGEVGGDGNEISDWIELDDDKDGGGDGGEEEEEDVVIDDGEAEDDTDLGMATADEEDVAEPEETSEYWNKQWNEALKNSDKMEKLVTISVEASTEAYKRQMMNEQRNKEIMEMQRMEEETIGEEMPTMMDEEVEIDEEDEKNTAMLEADESNSSGYRGPRRRVKRSRIPPELFLRAAVRPFTYRNLVKEIVLLRHAIIDQEVNAQG